MAQQSTFGLNVEITSDGRMVVRSRDDEGMQKKFDQQFEGKQYTIETTSELRKGKTLNWNSRKKAKRWVFFSQGAMEEDGRPVVRCMVCGDILQHGGIFGPMGLTTHVKKVSHLKKAKELVYDCGKSLKIPTEVEILTHLRRSGSEGLVVGGQFF